MPTSSTVRSRRDNDKSKSTTTNIRSGDEVIQQALDRLCGLLDEQKQQSFEIGDLVDVMVRDQGLTVKKIADRINKSPQRLGEYRKTAIAFSSLADRKRDVDFHYYTIAARAARKLGIEPAEALDQIIGHGITNVREATAFLAAQMRARENAKAALGHNQLLACAGDLIDRCHHDDFRNVMDRLPAGSVKLIFADPPYGRYGKFSVSCRVTSSSARRDCDGLDDDSARAATVDLLSLAGSKMAKGGCLVLCRPGASLDPAWLTTAIEDHGWECECSLTWSKGKTQLGRGDEPYGISSERLLVLVRAGDRLTSHDGAHQSDVLAFRPICPSYATGADHHVFEKPIELARFFVGKHTYEGELVFEPFGGTGPASAAAAQLGGAGCILRRIGRICRWR